MAGTRSSVKSASCKSIAHYVAFLHPSVPLRNPTNFLHNILNTCSASRRSDSSRKWNCRLVFPACYDGPRSSYSNIQTSPEHCTVQRHIPTCYDGPRSSYSNIQTLPEHCTAHRHIPACYDGPRSSYSNIQTSPEHCTVQRHIPACYDGPRSSYSNIQTSPEHCTAQRHIQTTLAIWIEQTHCDLRYGTMIWKSRWLKEWLTPWLSDTTNNKTPFQWYLLQWQQNIV